MATEMARVEEQACDDHSLDQKIGELLRIGMYSAATVILIGGVLFLSRHGNARPEYHTFQTLPPSLRSPVAIVKAACHGDSMSVMQLGMLLLIATPVARVVFSVFAFAVRRDVLYVAISAIVLGVLLYSLLLH